MMGIRNRLALGLLAGAAAACASSPEPVPVVAEPGELAQLAGEWSGYYDSPAVDRHGSIVFVIEAGRDTAYGEVTMVPSGWKQPLGPYQDPAAAARVAPRPETLLIRFVRIERGVVNGTMEPYRDPDCGCAVYTTFKGLVKDDLIEGTFTSRPGHGAAYKGTWLVRRKKKG
jgi:hypothetical protein